MQKMNIFVFCFEITLNYYFDYLFLFQMFWVVKFNEIALQVPPAVIKVGGSLPAPMEKVLLPNTSIAYLHEKEMQLARQLAYCNYSRIAALAGQRVIR